MKHSQAREYLRSIMLHNIEVAEKGSSVNDYIIPFFIGDPGVGKTDIPKQVAEEAGIPYFQTIVAQYDAGEMAGLPFIGERAVEHINEKGEHSTSIEKTMIRLRPSYLPDINDPNQLVGIYNLDELPQAFLANQNICSQIVNEYRVGDHRISRGITICATGNKPENKAGTTTMPTHLKDRLNFITIEVDADDWLEYASKKGLDRRVRAYIKQNPGKLHKFNVAANANQTPRSWTKTSAILGLNLPQAIRTEAIAGQIGEGAGSEFESWLRVEDRMPKLEDVINKPEEAPLFGNRDSDVLYLLVTALADVAKPDNIENIIKYIKRIPAQEFAAVWAKDAFTRDKSLLQLSAVTKWKLTDGAKLIF